MKPIILLLFLIINILFFGVEDVINTKTKNGYTAGLSVPSKTNQDSISNSVNQRAGRTDVLSGIKSEYEQELYITQTAGYRTITGEILAAEAAISESVAKRTAEINPKTTDPNGIEAPKSSEMHFEDARKKYLEAIDALKTARQKKLPALPENCDRDMWFGGHIFIHDDANKWQPAPGTTGWDYRWIPQRNMDFERIMKSYGLDFMAATAPLYSWKLHETEKGVFDFSVAGYYLSELQKMGIYTTVNSFEGRSGGIDLPDWFKEKYSGKYEFIDNKGETLLQHAMSVVPIATEYVDQLEWRNDMKDFVVQATNHASKFDNVVFDCISPEQMYWGASVPYTPEFMKGFPNWLQDKYLSVKKLNEVWSANYSHFNEIIPPGTGRKDLRNSDWENKYNVDNSTAAIYDYVTYAEDAMVHFERDKRSWVDDGSGNNLNVLGGKGPDRYVNAWAEFARSGINLWKAKGNDKGISNCDIYSKEPFDWIINLDLITSINNHGGFAIEYNSSDRGDQTSYGMTSDEYRICMWSGIGHGLKGGNIWGLRRLPPMGYSRKFSCVDENNLPFETGMEVIRLNNQSRILSQIMGGALTPRENVAVYFPHETFNQKYHFKNEFPWAVEICGLHELLCKAGYHVKFISDENIEEISNYKVVIMPYSPIIPQKSNSTIHNYVRNGGRLIAFGMPAHKTELFQPVETLIAEPLKQVFGAEISPSARKSGNIELPGNSFISIPEEYTFTESSIGMKRICLESKPFVQEEKYAPSLFDIKPVTAEPNLTWEDGSSAVIKNNYGKGTSAFCGFLPGEKYMASAPNEKIDMQSWIKDLIGIEPELSVDNQNIETGLLKNENGYFLVLVNRAENTENVKVNINIDEITKKNKGEEYDLLRQTEGKWESKSLMVSIEPQMPVLFYFPIEKTTSIHEKQTEKQVVLFPNPATGFISINGIAQNNSTATIYSVNGQKIKEYDLMDHNRISLTGMTPRVYILTISTQKENRIYKFIKE